MNTFDDWRRVGQVMRWARAQGFGHARRRDEDLGYTAHHWWWGNTEVDIAAAGETTYDGEGVSDFGVHHGRIHLAMEAASGPQILDVLVTVGLIPARFRSA
jgi:hypothetical protein